MRKARQLGQYRLGRCLGAGGMGEVYLGEHLLLRRPCAIKLIRPERVGDPKNLQRFEREVRATATLTHPNTIQIFDYGHADDGTFYYVMEYLEGMTLEQLVTAHGPLPPARAIHCLRQLCGALREAHAIGLIHRDIKPGNVMVCERGGVPDVVKLLDFGLVLSLGGAQDGERLTQQGAISGTPAYMSPEQAEGREDLDLRSDIYSLGGAGLLRTDGPSNVCRSLRDEDVGSSPVRAAGAADHDPPGPARCVTRGGAPLLVRSSRGSLWGCGSAGRGACQMPQCGLLVREGGRRMVAVRKRRPKKGHRGSSRQNNRIQLTGPAFEFSVG